MDGQRIKSVEYKSGRVFKDMIFLAGNARIILDNDEEIFCVGGVVFSEGLEG